LELSLPQAAAARPNSKISPAGNQWSGERLDMGGNVPNSVTSGQLP